MPPSSVSLLHAERKVISIANKIVTKDVFLITIISFIKLMILFNSLSVFYPMKGRSNKLLNQDQRLTINRNPSVFWGPDWNQF